MGRRLGLGGWADIRKVAPTYRLRTGLGTDCFNPRWLGWLSDVTLDGFAKLLMAIEAPGVWPTLVQQIVIALIPKADGGRRPIGLLAMLVRVWERVRRPIVQSWRRSVERDYNWAGKGRSAQAAVWKQALLDEVALGDGKHAAAALLDLVHPFTDPP